MGTTRTKYSILALAVVAGAALMVTAPFVVQRQRAAHAEEIRARCVREFSAKAAWRAEIIETEQGSDGKRAVMRQEVLVRRPGEYRMTLRERDENDREVVSTTIRTRDAFYTRRTNSDGTTELHVIRGARPSLGVELENLLGQTVQAVADAKPLRVVGGGSRNDRPADKLELGPGHFIWVDRATGMPVEEHVISNGKVVHSVRISSLDDNVEAPDNEFDPATLGAVDVTTVEDLGFRSVASASDAAAALGFMPLDVSVPDGFSVDAQGYVDPNVPNGDAPTEGSYVISFSKRPNGVIVTQVSRPGVGDSFVPSATEEAAFEGIDVGGRPGAVFSEESRSRLVFARDDVLVTVEGNVGKATLQRIAARIR